MEKKMFEKLSRILNEIWFQNLNLLYYIFLSIFS